MRITARAVLLSLSCTTFALTPAAAQNATEVVGLDRESVTIDLAAAQGRGARGGER